MQKMFAVLVLGSLWSGLAASADAVQPPQPVVVQSPAAPTAVSEQGMVVQEPRKQTTRAARHRTKAGKSAKKSHRKAASKARHAAKKHVKRKSKKARKAHG